VSDGGDDRDEQDGQAQRRQQPRQRQQVERHRDVLRQALELAAAARGDHAVAGERAAHGRDGDLAAEDDEGRPPRQGAEQRQADQGRADQRLVGDGVGHHTEVGDLPAAARDVAVDHVGEAGEHEQHRGQHPCAVRRAVEHQQPGEERHDEQPPQRQDVGQVQHGDDGRPRRAVVGRRCGHEAPARRSVGPAAVRSGARSRVAAGEGGQPGEEQVCGEPGRLDLRHVPDAVQQVQCPVGLQRRELRHAGDGHQPVELALQHDAGRRTDASSWR
jgi:hypothetical protein